MISPNTLKYFCNEDISLIENYENAVTDETQIWHCHHRLETDKNLSVKKLKSMNMYYHRPASELIFLTPFEHMSLHNKGKSLSKETKKLISKNHADISGENHPLYGKSPSEETRKKQSESQKGKRHSEETKQKMRLHHADISGENNPNFGKSPSEETRKKQSESMKGKYWINNGKNQKRISKDQLQEYLDKGYKLGRK
jgi:hypothetical protein